MPRVQVPPRQLCQKIRRKFFMPGFAGHGPGFCRGIALLPPGRPVLPRRATVAPGRGFGYNRNCRYSPGSRAAAGQTPRRPAPVNHWKEGLLHHAGYKDP